MSVGLPFREIPGSLWYRVMSWLWVKLEWWAWRCRRLGPVYTVLSVLSWYADKARFWRE